MASLLSEQDQQTLRELFDAIQHPVKLVMFTQEFECQFCRETRQISEEVAALSDHIELTVFDLVKDKEQAEAYKVDKIPAIAVLRGGDEPRDYGIRYFGIPSGYEFSSLIEDIRMVGSGDSGLAESTRTWLANLDEELHLQVFVTPTCPYCPQAVVLAHKMAMESDLVTADMVEATEFPHLAQKYQVMGVPRTVINETVFQEGAAPEGMMIAKMEQALSKARA
jgi:glutaredoxin-like protein